MSLHLRPSSSNMIRKWTQVLKYQKHQSKHAIVVIIVIIIVVVVVVVVGVSFMDL